MKGVLAMKLLKQPRRVLLCLGVCVTLCMCSVCSGFNGGRLYCLINSKRALINGYQLLHNVIMFM